MLSVLYISANKPEILELILPEESKMSLQHHGSLTRRGLCTCCMVAAGIGATRGWLRPAEA
jgi:hypothetical protein